ncbi:IS110 family RNA-guided transposase [Geodermatophilus chilensis]|uniref:IS110 family transposase n=1 Tax=Geodermatophilus chilensis TaxID=2035835 RepID=UPI000C266C21|nr:IS110 family transposase [Geodermatophilus chilensis]
MRIVGGLDIHRRQITFDYLDERSGETRHGRIAPADRMLLRGWLQMLVGDAGTPTAFAVEGCTGWRFVVEELQRAGIEAHLAEPADTSAARGPKRRAKTDWADARLLRDLLADGRLPESWIPPAQVLEMRARLQLFRDLREQHTAWLQRIHAILLHHGAPTVTGSLLGLDSRRRLEAGEGLSPAGQEAVAAALRIVDALDAELDPLRKQITAFAGRQPGCRALQADYGIGPITATALWTELGDSRRFSASRKAVRHTGLDITVHSSDGKRPPGRLSRQGSPLLRWALFEAAQCAARPGSPDHAYYRRVADRVGGNRAALSVARKMVRRAHHTLRALGDEALAPV